MRTVSLLSVACIVLTACVTYVAAWAKDSDYQEPAGLRHRDPWLSRHGIDGATARVHLRPRWDPHWSWDRGGATWTVRPRGNRGFAGEQKAEGVMCDDRPLADLDGLTRWTYSEQITETGT